MMDLVDELATPGCPQCFKKHMSAALSSLIQEPGLVWDDPQDVLLHRAMINIVEVREGYRSHLPYVIGILNSLEQAVVLGGPSVKFTAQDIRRLRLAITERPDSFSLDQDFTRHTPNPDFLFKVLTDPMGYDPDNYAVAHIKEAFRELPVAGSLLDEDKFPGLRLLGGLLQTVALAEAPSRKKIAGEIQAALAAIDNHFRVPQGAESIEQENKEKYHDEQGETGETGVREETGESVGVQG